MAKNKNLGATAEFRIKREKKDKLKTWQKVILGIISSVVVIVAVAAIVIVCMLAFYKNRNLDESINSGETAADIGSLEWATKVFGEEGSEVLSQHSNEESPYGKSDVDFVRKEDTYTFLVLGSDRAKWLTDVIMIATYDMKNQKMSIMQIPRDTYVMVNSNLYTDNEGNITYDNFDGKGDYGCKINSVVWHGGNMAGKELNRITKLAKDADNAELKKICKESFLNISADELKNYMSAKGKEKSSFEYNTKLEFGIKYLTALLARAYATPIDFYAQLNLDGFVNIVDAIGGVDVYIQQDMNYEDLYQDPPLKIHLKKGQQHLDGKKSEQFIRFRYGYAAADIARIDAQKIFLTAFIKKVFSLEGVLNIKTLYDEVSKNLTTNLVFDDVATVAAKSFDLNFNEIVMLTMPGWPQYKDGVSYYSVDRNTMIEYVNTYLSKYSNEIPNDYFCAVELGNGVNYTTPPMTAEDIETEQPDLGFMY